MRTALLSRLRAVLAVCLGVALGTLTALPELLLAVAGGLRLLVVAVRKSRPADGSWVVAATRRLSAAERRRMASCYGVELPVPATGRSALGYLAVRWALGLFGGAVLLLTLLWAGAATFLLWGWFVLDRLHRPGDVLLSAFLSLFLCLLGAQGVQGVAILDERLARHFLTRSDPRQLERRIGELALSRAGVVEAVHDERRRIERDLHDGVQQRLVALGMLLGRARRGRDPEKAAELLRQAHEEAQRALTDLREVAWRIYPAALDEGGLGAALETVAERAAVPVRLSVDLPEPLPAAVQTVAYFVVAEAVTNATKHSGAALVTVRVARQGTMVIVRIEDDGRGGADPAGGGLTGLARRVAALDGRFTVDSPAGGPTTVTGELPCA
ncbi:sensor histidine kinase [Streptomyces huiliensis]|uniref:sensor histidine kinase n=1 Tax=Streptomyces huiliensis TaxID=2876027 RepID=UPI001CBD57D9|nr:sensor histidine kinase [Streptomyces huiliensis]MBZ4320231.1 sensor histidine kinase [Streptomyces huiliensis]